MSNARKERIDQAVALIRRGWTPPLPTDRIVDRVIADIAVTTEQTLLSPKCLEVLHLRARGFTNKEVADERGVAEETVKAQVKQVIQVLGAKNMTHAVAIGYELGLIEGEGS